MSKTKLKLELDSLEVDLIVRTLSKRPYEKVAHILNNIASQVGRQMASRVPKPKP